MILIRLAFSIVMVGLLAAVPGDAQLRLYDAKRDAVAQEAKKAAATIQSGDLFKKQTQNLRLLSEKDVAMTIADAHQEMSALINSFITWADVENLRDDLKRQTARQPPPDVQSRIKQLDAQETALKGQITQITAVAANGSPELDHLVSSIGQFDAALKFAKDNVSVDGAAVTTTISVLDQLQSLYTSYQQQIQAVDKAAAQLRELKVNLKKTLLARLKVEEDYLVAQAGLYERREKELGPVRQLLDVCRLPTGASRDDRIDDTLEKLAGDRSGLSSAVRSLYAGAALASQGALPDRLFRLRMAQLDHMRSIQMSAANASVYEAILGSGVDRLALFYQGGVKPETIAQIAQALATSGIFGKVVTQ
jgi:23S rRNA U2552 (ribose-2'-O)-methylase RlmE/FtsJ